MSITCIICDEKCNKSNRKPIKCQYCEFECCRTCCQTIILDQPTVRCMNNDCAKEWTRQYIRAVLPLTFINNDLKLHKEQILFDQERALMPATQPIIERRIRIEELQKEEQQMRILINNMRRQLDEINQRLFNERYGIRNRNQTDTTTEAARFVRACPSENCRGFLSTQWKCGICQLWSCPTCHVVKGETRDAEHTCNPDDVATAELLNSDTKPCPKCGFGIFKIDGCSQMFCTQCHTAFDWRTGRIETNHIHNPHYFEWMRRQGNNPERNPNDVICGRELDHRLVREIDSEIGNKIVRMRIYNRKEEEVENKRKQNRFVDLARNIIHIRQVEMYRYEYNYERNNEELRILYMQNRISEDEFKRRLQIQNKKHHKQMELRNIFRLVVDSMTDIIYRFYDEVRKNDWPFDFTILDEAEPLRQYANECLADISRTYNSIKIQLNSQFDIVKKLDENTPSTNNGGSS